MERVSLSGVKERGSGRPDPLLRVRLRWWTGPAVLEVWGFEHARSEAPGRKTHRRSSLGFVHEADKHAKSAVESVQLSGTTSDCVP